MDGQGLGSKGVHRIVIHANSSMDVFETADGPARRVRFDAVLGDTIAADRAWFLRAGPEIPECMRVSEDGQTMVLADDHVEGILWHFARVP